MEVDSLIELFHSTDEQSEKFEISKNIYDRTDHVSFRNFSMLGEEVLGFTQDSIDLYHKYLYAFSESLILLGEFEKVDSLLDLNISSCKHHNDSLQWSNALKLKGTLNSLRNQKGLAVQFYHESIELKKKINDWAGMNLIHNSLGTLYMGRRDFLEASKNLKKGLKVNEERNTDHHQTRLLAHLAECYIEMDSFEEAQLCIMKVKPRYEKLKNSHRRYYPLFLETIFNLKLKQTDAAFVSYTEYCKGVENYYQDFNIAYLGLKVARAFGEKGKYEIQKSILDSCSPYIKQSSLLDFHLSVNEQYVSYYLEKKNFELCKEYNEKWKEYAASYNQLINENAKQSQDLLFKKQRLSQELDTISEADKSKTKQIKYQYIFGLLLASILLFLAFVLYKYYRQTNDIKKLYNTIKANNKILQANISEKDFLMKEIHHRVKNNLQTISSLLNLQANYIVDKKAQNSMQSSMNRIQSIALIHQFLYEKDNVDSVDISKYIESLIHHLSEFFQMDDSQITIHQDIDSMRVKVETMNSLGLLVNELIINAMKYAFPDGRKGNLNISLKRIDKGLHLIVEDDGVGLNQGFAIEQQTNFGFFLIKTLTKKLKGVLEITSNNGTTVSILLKKIKLKS